MLFHAFICLLTQYYLELEAKDYCVQLVKYFKSVTLGIQNKQFFSCSVSHGDAANFELMPLLKNTKQ